MTATIKEYSNEYQLEYQDPEGFWVTEFHPSFQSALKAADEMKIEVESESIPEILEKLEALND